MIRLATVAPTTMPAIGPSTMPSDATEMRPRARVPRDFVKLSGLTDDEKARIVAIQEKLDKDTAELKKQALADQRSVLTDDQRTELEANLARAKAEGRAGRAKQRAEKA